MKNFLFFCIVTVVFSCTPKNQSSSVLQKKVSAESFDTVIDGKQVSLFVLSNEKGIELGITNYGARIVYLIMPDKNGIKADVVLGYNNIKDYMSDKIYSGCIVGRYANRIKDGKFKLEGKEYHMFKNDGKNTLHGGKAGLDKKIWDAKQEGNKLSMTYLSPDGEEGYPGNIKITKSYTLMPDNSLKIEYEAVTDQITVINLTNHTYWNLKGEGDSTVLDHYFEINADTYTPVDNEWIPTGEIAPVKGTPFDFTLGKKIGQDINAENEQLKNGLGYDHNWVLNKDSVNELSLAGKLWEETSGRMIEIYTTEPGMQFYSGNFFDSSVVGKSGKTYKYRSALVFEAQHFPDSPNQAAFPSTILKPGETYRQTTLLKFGLSKKE